jgi:hypothetical protein
MVGMSFGSN